MSEMFVSYMDPEEEWYAYTFLYASDYDLGL
jgi:Cu2+-containing amine oxidase